MDQTLSAGGSEVGHGVVEHPTAGDFAHALALPTDRTWFTRAVFYEVLVRAFYDSDADGSGDLRGLIERLDYLHWLGVDCLWLPPFYDSPLRDGGYDIRDFYKVLPEFGTVEDFVALLDSAHRCGIRIITDLVMNHTSDSHPWFQESRRDPDGPYGDFYVWSDTSDRYPDARVIFVDTEDSNWTFDAVRRQFYWHRFFAHQPDLNYDNPAVQNAMIDVLRFWLARPRDRRLPSGRRALSVRAGGHQLREPSRDARLSQAVPCGGRRRVPRQGAAGRGQPVAGRRGRVLRRSRHRRRRVPHGLPLSPHAKDFHGCAPGVAVSDLGDHGAHPPRFPIWHSGESSCATTTS